jgi:hypothetical protein
MIYTNKTHIVADTLDELHKFAKGLGLTKGGILPTKSTGAQGSHGLTIPSLRRAYWTNAWHDPHRSFLPGSW